MARVRARLLLLMATSAGLVPCAFAQTGGGSMSLEQLQAKVMAQVQQVGSITSKLPRVDVTHVDFAAGCPNAADAKGISDSTCAIRNAIKFAQSNPVKGGGYPLLYFPHGRYRVAGNGFTAALTFTAGVGMVGDGAQSTTIFNTSTAAGTVAYNNAEDCASKPGPCFLKIEGITFAAMGHTSMGGLIELNSTNTGLMRDVVLAESGGIGLNLQGSSERWIFSQLEIDHVRWPVLTEGDTNENYFERVNVTNPAMDASHFCFSVNCPGGHLITNGTWMPDPHSAVYLDGDNVHWNNSSIKSTAMVGGLHLAPVTSSISHTYIEGYAYAKQPRTNHSVEIGGKLELGHLTQALSAQDLTVAVDDAGWQPLYVNDPALVTLNGSHSYTANYMIFPADYAWQSKDPSSAVPGISRGTFERVHMASFAGDGRGHMQARGQNGTAAIAWPAGSIIEQVPPNNYGVARIESNHFNSVGNYPGMSFASGCDDTAQLSQWTSSPSRLCAEIIAGLVPDGYGVPFPTQRSAAPGTSLAVISNTIFVEPTESEQPGEGWIKIPGNANLEIDQDNAPLSRFTSADQALNKYVNGSTRVQVIKWGSASALAVVHDMSANVIFSTQDHYFNADINTGGSLGHQYLGEQCWYALQPGAQQPSSRFCVRANGPAQENLVSGHWVTAH